MKIKRKKYQRQNAWYMLCRFGLYFSMGTHSAKEGCAVASLLLFWFLLGWLLQLLLLGHSIFFSPNWLQNDWVLISIYTHNWPHRQLLLLFIFILSAYTHAIIRNWLKYSCTLFSTVIVRERENQFLNEETVHVNGDLDFSIELLCFWLIYLSAIFLCTF